MDSVRHKIQSAFAGVVLRNWRQAFFSFEYNSEFLVKCHTFFFKRVMQSNVRLFLPISFLPSFPPLLPLFLPTYLPAYISTYKYLLYAYHVPSSCLGHKDKKDAVLSLSSYYQKDKKGTYTNNYNVVVNEYNGVFQIDEGKRGFLNKSQHPVQGQEGVRAFLLFIQQVFPECLVYATHGMKHVWKNMRHVI